jgi:phosphate transport system substrate-binding protein
MKTISILLICFTCLTGMGRADVKLSIDGSTTVGPIAKAFAEYFMNKNPKLNITVSESGSGNGAKSLIKGNCDIGCLSRAMKKKEVKMAVKNQVIPTAHMIALDGIAIVVHPSNRLSNLKLYQVNDIYLGRIKNWKVLGGPNMKIVVVSRDTNSGTFETFHKLVMKKKNVINTAETVGSNGAVRARVQATRAAIGYIGLGFVDRTVKALDINQITPSRISIRGGVYPIARPLFMYTNKFPEMGSLIYRFITFHLTKTGQQLIEEIGFIPVTSY